jgi:hypothetical protein
MSVPPWLEITPSSYLQSMEAGSQIGLRRQQLAQQAQEEQARNALAYHGQQQQAQQEAAANALRTNQLLQVGQEASGRLALGNKEADNSASAALMSNAIRSQEIEKRSQEDDAMKALEMERLKQGGELGQQRIDALTQRNNDLADYRGGQLNNAADLLDLKSKIASNQPVTISDKASGTTIKMDGESYANYLTAQKNWASKSPPKEIPGRLFGTNPNPEYDSYVKNNPEPQPTDFLNQKTAAESLKSGLSKSSKNPTRAVASQYVSKYGSGAKQKLIDDGYDVSNYAD